MDKIKKNIFITELTIKKVRHLKDIHIPLSDTELKHLILTGKNGSGKTSVLETLANLFNDHEKFKKWMSYNLNTGFITITDRYWQGGFILAFYDAKRQSIFEKPVGLNKIDFHDQYGINEKPGKAFLQYLVNLKAEKSFARDDGDDETANTIGHWFEMFEKILKELFDDPGLKLEFDRKNFNFQIIQEEKDPFDFNTLADGYSAILEIITDLILRMEKHKTKNYDAQGIVLIDEVETHLHIDLQKKILPFLTRFFPRVQFIVSTHSPFVLSSIPNAVIYDLEKRLRVSDLSYFSYSGIVESYYDNDNYSQHVKDNLEQYEQLINKTGRTESEERLLRKLRKKLDETPRELAPELKARFLDIKLARIGKQ